MAFLNIKLEEAAERILSEVTSSGTFIYRHYGTELIEDNVQSPAIKIETSEWEPLYPELNIGVGKINVDITYGVYKSDTTTETFDSASNVLFARMLSGSIDRDLESNTSNLCVHEVLDGGCVPDVLSDSLIATQKLTVFCSRT
jgi:hypothetical protein